MGAMVATDLEATVATATERGLPMLRPRLSPSLRLSQRLMPTMAWEAMAVTAMAVTTARGPLMPRLTTAATVMAATAAMVAMEATDTERGLLMPKPTMAAMAMEAMEAMAAMVATDTARGPLMPTTAVDTATAVMAMAVTDTASKLTKAYFLRISTSFHEL